MSSDVDICNLALGFLGDSANVDAIDPPEDSVEAEYCAKFYPIARDGLLNMHNWGFATKRTSPAQIAVPPESAGMWQYAYIAPGDCLTITRVFDPTSSDDLVSSIPQPYDGWWNGSTSASTAPSGMGAVVPQPFSVETDANGDKIIYSNVAGAAISYTAQVTDTTKFGPSFVIALATLLSAYLAGPILKGSDGRKAYMEIMRGFNAPGGPLSIATMSDANERRVDMSSTTPWLTGR